MLPDNDAKRILNEMDLKKPPHILYHTQVASLTGAIRQYNLSWAINDYLKIHLQACVVEMGAELSCLRRQMKNNSNDWINFDLNKVIKLGNQYIPWGKKERNYVCNLTDHYWFNNIPFNKENGVIVAAGVLHYLKYEDVKNLLKVLCIWHCFT